LLDLATRKIDILTPSGKHGEFLPAWSPNGNEIAFVTKRGDDPDRTVNWDVWVVGAKPGRGGAASYHPLLKPTRILTGKARRLGVPMVKLSLTSTAAIQRKSNMPCTLSPLFRRRVGEAKVLTAKFGSQRLCQPHWSADGQIDLRLAGG